MIYTYNDIYIYFFFIIHFTRRFSTTRGKEATRFVHNEEERDTHTHIYRSHSRRDAFAFADRDRVLTLLSVAIIVWSRTSARPLRRTLYIYINMNIYECYTHIMHTGLFKKRCVQAYFAHSTHFALTKTRRASPFRDSRLPPLSSPSGNSTLMSYYYCICL